MPSAFTHIFAHIFNFPMKNNLLFIFLFVFSFSIAQDKAYFQQQVNYTINVKLDDIKHDLNADATIEYINNSPDELSFIWFHLWPNAYKNNETALAKQLIEDGNKKFYFAEKHERGWIDGLDFKVNGQGVKTEAHPEYIDIVKIILNEPLKPGAKTVISTPFHVHIPIGVFSRLGHIGQQYQITQWYPKPAVYDKYGWHPMPYINQGEFYSEWGNFDVFITVPKNYVVGATGDYVDGDEEIAWLNKKAELSKEMEVFPRDTTFPPSSSEWKTLHLHQEKVHDFAWFADKRYYVVKDEVELPYTKRKVTTWGMFTGAEGKLWKQSAKYTADAVYYYSLWNGEYPYNHATAVDGALSAGGGMEYPNITVIGKMNDARSLDRVIAHEVGHNWFYGILGSNERDHAWMDEGINSFNEGRYMDVKYPKDSMQTTAQTKIGGVNVDIGKLLGMGDMDESELFDLAFRFSAMKKLDQPCDFPSAEYTQINYGTVVYGKTAVVFEYLRAYLGTELFDKCAQKYFDEWKFRHPYPDDIKKVYEDVSGKDLDWFFDEIIETTKKVDYKICSVKKSQCANSFTGDCWEVAVKNKGEIASPFSLTTLKDGRPVTTTWFDGIKESGKVNVFAMDFDEVKLDYDKKMPDLNRKNNNYKMHGLCKKTEPFNLKMLGLVHNTDKTQLFWVPAMGWNNYNKFMLGTVIYNNLLPEKKLEWALMPMYGFGNKDLAGGASINYNMHFRKVFQTIRLGVNAERYCYLDESYPTSLPNLNYNKIAPELFLEIRKKHLRSSVKQTIRIRNVNIIKETVEGDYSFSPPIYSYDVLNISINDITYKIDNSRKINPCNVSLNIQQEKTFTKASVTGNYSVTLKKKNKSIDLRGFAGFFNSSGSGTYFDGNYRLYTSGGTGAKDYLYDNVFLGRSEYDGFLSHQFTETEGAMKVYTPLGRSADWLTSINIKCPLPGKMPIKLFADFVMIPETVALNQSVLYDAGIYIPLVPNYVEVYFPLLMSKDITDVFKLNNPSVDGFQMYMQMARFTFNIHNLNPFEIVRNLSL